MLICGVFLDLRFSYACLLHSEGAGVRSTGWNPFTRIQLVVHFLLALGLVVLTSFCAVVEL